MVAEQAERDIGSEDYDRRIRRIADHMVRRLEGSSDHAVDQMVKVSGWLNASLLAINGAGAVTSVNVAGRIGNVELPAALFALGIIFALLSAVTIQGLAELAIQPIENMIAFWNDVGLTGNYDENIEQQARKGMDKVDRWRWICPALGWVSGVLFLIGGTVLGLQVRSQEHLIGEQCSSLQRDMLSTHPARTDSRELFVALHCGE